MTFIRRKAHVMLMRLSRRYRHHATEGAIAVLMAEHEATRTQAIMLLDARDRGLSGYAAMPRGRGWFPFEYREE